MQCNNIAQGVRVEIAYAEETVCVNGIAEPADGLMKVACLTSRTINPSKETLESAKVRADRQKSDVRHGFNSVEGSFGAEMALTDQNDFIRFAMSGTWAAVGTGLQTIDLDATDQDNITLTRGAGDYLVDGFRPGDIVDASGYTNVENNVRFRVKVVTATVLTVERLDTSVTAVTELGGADEAVDMVGERIDIGTNLYTFRVEQRFLDIPKFRVFKGVAINTMAVSVQPGSIVTVEYGLLGQRFEALADATVSTGDTAAAGTSPYSAFDGSLHEGGVKNAVVTGLDFTLDNGRSLSPVIGSKFTPGTNEGTANITGTLTAFFTGGPLYNKFVNEVDSSIWLRLLDVGGVEFMNIVMPRVKYTGADMDPPQQGNVPLSMPFSALVDSVTGTSLSIQKSDV